MYTLYKFHFLNGISEINQLFDDILIIWPAPVYIYMMHSLRYDTLKIHMKQLAMQCVLRQWLEQQYATKLTVVLCEKYKEQERKSTYNIYITISSL